VTLNLDFKVTIHINIDHIRSQFGTVSISNIAVFAVHKRGYCRHAVSVRPSVTFDSCAKTNKDIFEFFSLSGSQAILVFPCRTGWRYSDGTPLTGASNGGGLGRNRDSERMSGSYGISFMPVYRVTLIGVFLGHFCINLHQTCTQHSNEGPQHWNATRFQKKSLSKSRILSPKNSCL